jgi:hypothetical protein
MRSDLAALSEYHRKAEFVRRVEAAYATDFVAGSDGRPDRAATAAAIREVERSVRHAPARVRAKLLTGPLRPRDDGAVPPSSELGLILREANEKRAHLPFRRLRPGADRPAAAQAVRDQAVLERLGWRLCRIWSTDWVVGREKQVERVLNALATTTEPPGPATPPADPPPSGVPEKKATRTARPVKAYPSASFPDIDDVPEGNIRTILVSLVAEFGATQPDDLFRATARRIGFKKCGPKMKARFEGLLGLLIRERKLEPLTGGRIQAVRDQRPGL